MSRLASMMPSAAAARRSLPWVIVFASIFIGYRATMPPQPLPDSAPAEEFSAERAAVHVAALAVRPHPMGSDAIDQARAYITTELEELGLAVETHTVTRPSYYEDRMVPVINLFARIPGTANTGAIALVSHYDTVPETVGANDNTAAVAALLETGRALLAGSPLSNDVILLFTDSEEPAPHFGAAAFVTENPVVADLALAVNLEATGGSGASLLVETNGPEAWLIERLGEAGSRPAAFSFLTETSRLFGDIGTDFDEFRNAGIIGFHFAYIRGSDIYHTADDNLEALGHGSMQHHGDHVLGIARQFGALDLSLDRPDQRAIYFSIPPLLLSYSATWALPLMLIGLFGVVTGLVRRRNGEPALPAPRRGVGFMIVLLGMVIASLAWLAVVAVLPSLGLLQAYVTFAVLLTAIVLWVRWANNRFRPAAIRGLGPLLPLGVLAAITGVAGVGYSYLFTLPTLAVALAIWLGANTWLRRQLRFALVAVVTTTLLTPAIDVFLQFASPRPGNPDSDLGILIVLPLGLALLAIGLLSAFWPRASER